MKKIAVFLFSLLFGATAVAQERTTITKFEGKTITGVAVYGAFDVKLSQGSTTGARVEVPIEASEKLTYELTDEGYLRLGYGSDVGKYFTSNKNRPVAHITVSHLAYLALSGNCSVLGESTFTSPGNFVLTATGASFCDQMMVQSKAGANISVESGAKVEKLKLECQEKVVVSVEGSSLLTLSGGAPAARLAVSGIAKCDALGFTCPELQVSATGTSMMKIHISESADVTTGPMSAVRYTGSGKITGSGAKPL